MHTQFKLHLEKPHLVIVYLSLQQQIQMRGFECTPGINQLLLFHSCLQARQNAGVEIQFQNNQKSLRDSHGGGGASLTKFASSLFQPSELGFFPELNLSLYEEIHSFSAEACVYICMHVHIHASRICTDPV